MRPWTRVAAGLFAIGYGTALTGLLGYPGLLLVLGLLVAVSLTAVVRNGHRPAQPATAATASISTSWSG